MTSAAKNLKIESKQPEQIKHAHCTTEVKCEVILFNAPSEALSSYRLTMRMDTRSTPYHQALKRQRQLQKARIETVSIIQSAYY